MAGWPAALTLPDTANAAPTDWWAMAKIGPGRAGKPPLSREL
jgi:hypothetical protein